MLNANFVPILTDTYSSAESFIPDVKSIYIFGTSDEDRTTHHLNWKKNTTDLCKVEIFNQTLSQFEVKGIGDKLNLRSTSDIISLWANVEGFERIYIDITGLTHSVWARILQVALNNKIKTSVLYVEPDAYNRSLAPVDGMIYDLSNTIQGISPLAGFASLAIKSNEDFAFIPLLGFEGTRLKYMVEQVQPSNQGMTPIIGSPGFKPWYVFESYIGNKNTLLETNSWQNVRYAPANCPFSCFYLLHEIEKEINEPSIKVAMVGTKPHALGAVLFSLSANKQTELVYDHPVRKASRTSGVSKLLVYHVSSLFNGINPPYEINVGVASRRRRD